MPDTTTTIDGDQRDGLYELVRNHLGSVEDFWVALERTKDFAKAEPIRSVFSIDDLVDRIHWNPGETARTLRTAALRRNGFQAFLVLPANVPIFDPPPRAPVANRRRSHAVDFPGGFSQSRR